MVSERDMTPEQWQAFNRLFTRQQNEATAPKTFEQFCADASKACYDDCVMVPCLGMWLGIEKDGYTHS